MHPAYWDKEFTTQDSDLVMLIQSDSVFCHTFNVSQWDDLAYVGGIWPPNPWTHNNLGFAISPCSAIKEFWTLWNSEQHLEYPHICTNDRAPTGNGGFSLRSRKWMRIATNTCPSKYVTHSSKTDCNVILDIPEDLYFATVLPGLNAPMPNVVEASLLSVEMIFLETAMDYYPTNINVTDVAMKRLSNKDLKNFNQMRKEGRTVPIGLHKPWLYHSYDVLTSNQMERECPYLKHVLPSKWDCQRTFWKSYFLSNFLRFIAFFFSENVLSCVQKLLWR